MHQSSPPPHMNADSPLSFCFLSHTQGWMCMQASVHPGAPLEQQKRPCTWMHVSMHLWIDVPTSNQSGQTCLSGFPKCSATVQ